MKLCLSDNGLHLRFAPLTLTRPVAELRMGMFTNTERWQLLWPEAQISFETEAYLTKKFGDPDTSEVVVNANVIPTKDLIDSIKSMDNGTELVYKTDVIARKSGSGVPKTQIYTKELVVIEQIWDIFQRNGEVLNADFAWYTADKSTSSTSSSNLVLGDHNQLFISENVNLEACILNCKTGPIFIGEGAEIMEGSMLRGPLAIGAHAGVKMGTKIYGPTSIGPECRVGGEISNVVFQSYSNKGHDGFLGNAVIGEWCNLGADTNASNLKNNYSKITAWSYEREEYVSTGLQFMGLIMGDHSKCGINTMFNTATVVGVSSNIYGGDFPDKFIPSFSWGGASGFTRFDKNKAIEAAKAMMERRKVAFTAGDQAIFDALFPEN